MKTVVVIGAKGKMGRVTCQTLERSKQFDCIAQLDRDDGLSDALSQHHPDIAIDFTNANVVFRNCTICLENRIPTVVGASGLTETEVEHLAQLAEKNQVGCVVAPNFSLGAILMMQFAERAAKLLPAVEIVETHHPQKLDAPSGTATKTAQLIQKARQTADVVSMIDNTDCVPARGANINEVQVHSLRLPGFIANQQVIFGQHGENLIIQHQSIDRQSFMPGLLVACEKVTQIKQLVYGLEQLL